ncbi:unnamed protein product [Tenebrio molitor]|nr:unnamed protein product [Tenebrio molitor]
MRTHNKESSVEFSSVDNFSRFLFLINDIFFRRRGRMLVYLPWTRSWGLYLGVQNPNNNHIDCLNP